MYHFTQEYWMDEASVKLFSDPTYPFSLEVDCHDIPHPYISDCWAEVWSDSAVNRYDPEFTLGETTNML